MTRAAKIKVAAASLITAARNVLTTLAQTIKDLNAAAKCPFIGESLDVHKLNRDALLQIKTVLDAGS